ncbi:hypothetical protein SCP_1000100 [Sparassis crispa]|uniref:Uncharacterized protein n=1 Tax=Sparassis crispa TaxID=139825 RepID=A0A401GX04_9APHY|nr:hypothetical protein SCP_1000100 [Sparassis crispa]GBE86768.1 hypothetical protein SCP_1000100 [Sparassis crispa]
MAQIVSEGLFAEADHPFRKRTDLAMKRLRRLTEDFRLQSHCAATFFQQCSKMLDGLSWSISRLCTHAKRTRAEILSTTAEERKKLKLETNLEQSQRTAVQLQLTALTPPNTRYLDNLRDSIHVLDENLLDPENRSTASVLNAISSTIVLAANASGESCTTFHDNLASQPCLYSYDQNASAGSSGASGGTSTCQFPESCLTTAHTAVNIISAVKTATICDPPTADDGIVVHRVPVDTHLSDPDPIPAPHVSTIYECAIPPQGISSGSCHEDACDGNSTTPRDSLASSAGLSSAATRCTESHRKFSVPVPALGGQLIMPRLSSSNTAMQHLLREVGRKIVARRGLLYSRSLSTNAIRVARRRNHSSGGKSAGRIARPYQRQVDAQVTRYDIGDEDLEAFWEDCSDEDSL